MTQSFSKGSFVETVRSSNLIRWAACQLSCCRNDFRARGLGTTRLSSLSHSLSSRLDEINRILGKESRRASLGYVRVSTLERNADFLPAAREGDGCLRVYTDHGVSGTQARRPQLDSLLESSRARDELVVWKLYVR